MDEGTLYSKVSQMLSFSRITDNTHNLSVAGIGKFKIHMPEGSGSKTSDVILETFQGLELRFNDTNFSLRMEQLIDHLC